MQTVIIMRGCPGSGKSSYIKDNHPDAYVCSADSYFLDSSGIYTFDGSRLKQAHNFCKDQFKHALETGLNTIVVDNTNTRHKEMSPYIEMLTNYPDYKINIVRLKVDPVVAYNRCTHGVPFEKVLEMSQRLDVTPYPGELVLP